MVKVCECRMYVRAIVYYSTWFGWGRIQKGELQGRVMIGYVPSFSFNFARALLTMCVCLALLAVEGCGMVLLGRIAVTVGTSECSEDVMII